MTDAQFWRYLNAEDSFSEWFQQTEDVANLPKFWPLFILVRQS